MLSGLEMEMKRKPAFCWFPPSSSLCSQEQSGESTAADPGGAVDPVELAPQGRGQAVRTHPPPSCPSGCLRLQGPLGPELHPGGSTLPHTVPRASHQLLIPSAHCSLTSLGPWVLHSRAWLTPTSSLRDLSPTNLYKAPLFSLKGLT